MVNNPNALAIKKKREDSFGSDNIDRDEENIPLSSANLASNLNGLKENTQLG